MEMEKHGVNLLQPCKGVFFSKTDLFSSYTCLFLGGVTVMPTGAPGTKDNVRFSGRSGQSFPVFLH